MAITSKLILALTLSLFLACEKDSNTSEPTSQEGVTAGNPNGGGETRLIISPEQSEITISGGDFDGTGIDPSGVTSAEAFELVISLTINANGSITVNIETEDFSGEVYVSLSVTILDNLGEEVAGFEEVKMVKADSDGENAEDFEFDIEGDSAVVAVSGSSQFTISKDEGESTPSTVTPSAGVEETQTGFVWGFSLGSGNDDYSGPIAVDSANRLTVTGSHGLIVDFDPSGDSAPLDAGMTHREAFVATYNPDMTLVTATRPSFASPNSGVNGVAVNENDQIAITGFYSTTGTIFMNLLESDHSNVWDQSFGTSAFVYGFGINFLPGGDVVTLGKHQNDLNFGGGTLGSNGEDFYVVRRSAATGAHVWHYYSGGHAGSQLPADHSAPKVDASSNVYLVGDFELSNNFGGGLISSNGDEDGFILRLSASGTHGWSYGIGGSGEEQFADLYLDGDDLYVVGSFEQTVDFDMIGTGDSRTSAGSKDGFLLKMHRNGLVYHWTQVVSGTGTVTPWTLAGLSNGDIIVGGSYEGNVIFGSGASQINLSNSESYAYGFIAVYGPDGTVKNAHSIPTAVGTNGVYVRGLAVGSNDEVYITGIFDGIIDLNFDPAVNLDKFTEGNYDIFVVKYQY